MTASGNSPLCLRRLLRFVTPSMPSVSPEAINVLHSCFRGPNCFQMPKSHRSFIAIASRLMQLSGITLELYNAAPIRLAHWTPWSPLLRNQPIISDTCNAESVFLIRAHLAPVCWPTRPRRCNVTKWCLHLYNEKTPITGRDSFFCPISCHLLNSSVIYL